MRFYKEAVIRTDYSHNKVVKLLDEKGRDASAKININWIDPGKNRFRLKRLYIIKDGYEPILDGAIDEYGNGTTINIIIKRRLIASMFMIGFYLMLPVTFILLIMSILLGYNDIMNIVGFNVLIICLILAFRITNHGRWLEISDKMLIGLCRTINGKILIEVKKRS